MMTLVQEIKQKFDTLGFSSYGPPNPIGMWPNEQECLIWCCTQSNYGGDWLEIGSYTGGSTSLLCFIRRYMNLLPHVYSIDVEFDRQDGLFDKNIKQFGFTDLSKKIVGNSKDVIMSVNTHLDLVLMDGHHSFKYSILDFFNFHQYMHDKTIIIFHDASPKMFCPTEKYLTQLDDHVDNHYEKLMNVVRQDYRIDEAIRYICKNYGYEIITIPCYSPQQHYRRDIPLKWTRGLTSPFNSLVAIRKVT
jgi:predicted O-methyltransferase YrrM